MFLYEIRNTVNGMGYVGITKGAIEHRWWHHRKDLRTGNHGNRYLQRAYNKYGPEAFEYKIRQKCKSEQELSDLEREIVKKERGRLYNIREGGYSAPPVKHTEESKAKIGKAFEKSVVGMSIKTGEIKEYDRIKDTQKDGFNYKNIGKCCLLSVTHASGRTQQAISTGKWVWMYKYEFTIEEMERRRQLAKCRGNNNQSRAIMGKSLIDGSIVRLKSCLEASVLMGGHSTHVRDACLWKACRSFQQHVWVFTDVPEAAILLENRYVYAMKTFNGHRVIGPRSLNNQENQ